MLIDKAKTRVLIICRDKRVAGILEYILSKKDYRFDRAETGKEALFKLGILKPDIVLCDESALWGDGTKILQKVRRNQGLKNIPVLILTSIPSSEIKKKKAGTYIYIKKPLLIGQLYAKIERIIAKNRDRSS